MSFQIVYFLLAALGLSFLVFIHELGHYIVARRVGMRVEVFSIGFGKPIIVWYRKTVKWQIGWLLFGGYVRIAGMEKEGEKEPSDIPDGFYGKRPIDRIKVAIAGPLVNIVFAFLVFTGIWLAGGRYKPYDEFTNIIGWVDPQSQLYREGVRPGDTIDRYNHESFTGFRDLIYQAILKKDVNSIAGDKIDYFTGRKTPYSYALHPYSDPRVPDQDFRTIGVLFPANCLIYNRFINGEENPIAPDSPFAGSGLEYGDRIAWVDGHLVFSLPQFNYIVNQQTALLTVIRNGKKLLLNVPRVYLGELALSPSEAGEFDDWRHELGSQAPMETLVFVPYFIDADLVVTHALPLIDDDLIEETPAIYQEKLQLGDQILAVDGMPVTHPYEFLSGIQEKKVQMIVVHQAHTGSIPWKDKVNVFYRGVEWKAFAELIDGIGSSDVPMQIGNLKRLHSIVPRKVIHKQALNTKRGLSLKRIGLLSSDYNLLGTLKLQDQYVVYNPLPTTVFVDVCQETYRTFSALISGQLSPKWMSGPVGIVKVLHDGWSIGVKEALFWISVISLNLGLINLMPIPVLDGGHICFAFYEVVTRRPIKAKTMERMVLPFVVVLIMFFIYITMQDVMRLFH